MYGTPRTYVRQVLNVFISPGQWFLQLKHCPPPSRMLHSFLPIMIVRLPPFRGCAASTPCCQGPSARDLPSVASSIGVLQFTAPYTEQCEESVSPACEAATCRCQSPFDLCQAAMRCRSYACAPLHSAFAAEPCDFLALVGEWMQHAFFPQTRRPSPVGL